MVVVLDEGFDLGFEIAGQEVVFEQDAVLEGLVPALDLALGLRMEAVRRAHGSSSGPRYIRPVHPRCKLGPLSLSSLGLCSTVALSQPDALRASVQRVGDILGPHGACTASMR